jgi:hypothetical protein
MFRHNTCNPLVLAGAERVLVLVHQRSVRLLPVCFPTGEDILADAASLFLEDLVTDLMMGKP